MHFHQLRKPIPMYKIQETGDLQNKFGGSNRKGQGVLNYLYSTTCTPILDITEHSKWTSKSLQI